MSNLSRSRRTLLAVTCLGLTGGLVACGGGDSGESQSAGSADGALSELLGYSSDPTEQRKQDLEMQEIIAQCMRDAGYEYTPVDYLAQMPTGADEQYTDPEEFGKKYGYGIAYNYNLYERPGAEGNVPIDGEDGGFVDPNWDYQQSLSPDEQTAYQTALYGDQSAFMVEEGDITEETAFVPPPLEEQGCQGKAQLETYGESIFNNPDMSERLDQLFQDMEEDPRIQDANIAWSDCVYEADAAWDFLSPNEIYQYFEEYKAELQGLRRVEIDPQTGESVEPLQPNEYVMMSFDDGEGSSYGFAGEPKTISEEDLDVLQKEEIDLWKVDQDCQKDAGFVKIRKEVEEELVASFREEFPELAERDS